MDYENLRKELLAHRIYSAWQFIKYTEKNLDTVRYCEKAIRNIIEKMGNITVRWQQNIMSDFVDEVTEDGKCVKRLSVTTENSPMYEVRVVDEKIDPWFLFDKLLRDFFQYAMNTFDSMSQIINTGILANKGKKVDSVDIQAMTKCFNQQTYSADFPQMQAWLNTIAQSPEFQYIEAINNRTKHTGDISIKLSMGILGSSHKAEIGPFFRKDVQHDKNEIYDQLQTTMVFLEDSWKGFLNVFDAEIKKDFYNKNRWHGISGVRQQKVGDDPKQYLSYAYIEANGSFDAMPDEIYILFINEQEDEISVCECPFNTILITGSSNTDVLGRYIAEDAIGDDCLLHYRKYRKDVNVIGGICVYYIQQEKTVFYHQNPYFRVETVSDDNEFLVRTSLPF